MKQARAYGVGVVLATQNPMNLDYRALSNAGTWMIGRLQTDADRARVIEGLGEDEKKSKLAELVKKPGHRWFVVREAKSAEPTLLNPRWAMSYLRGPMIQLEIKRSLASRIAGRPAVLVASPSCGRLREVGAKLGDDAGLLIVIGVALEDERDALFDETGDPVGTGHGLGLSVLPGEFDQRALRLVDCVVHRLIEVAGKEEVALFGELHHLRDSALFFGPAQCELDAQHRESASEERALIMELGDALELGAVSSE
jgi:hypothetical protein